MRHRLTLLLPILLWGFLPGAAPAVVISTGDGSGNTSAPADDPGFANVGVSSNALSGVYLGYGWVLTAAHVGDVTSFSFGGVLYPTVPGSRQQISKDGSPADLAMIELEAPWPPLPDVVLPSAPIAVSEPAILVGNGWNREATATCWNSSWMELNCPGGVYEGFKRQGSRTMRWGRNRVDAVDLDTGSTRTFGMVFDEAGEVDEGQVVAGDSGGASFVKRSGTWELVGSHAFMGGVPTGQPADSVIFTNSTLDVDVHHYRDEIEALLLPPIIPSLPRPALLLLIVALPAVARRVLARRG